MRWGHSLDIADDNPVPKPQLLATHKVSILYSNYTLIKLINNRSLIKSDRVLTALTTGINVFLHVALFGLLAS